MEQTQSSNPQEENDLELIQLSVVKDEAREEGFPIPTDLANKTQTGC